MKTIAEIDKEIDELEEQLKQIEGRPTEVYSRIVGYYRSLRNWNRGKREEYSHRVVFDSGIPSNAGEDAGAEAATGDTVPAGAEAATGDTVPAGAEAATGDTVPAGAQAATGNTVPAAAATAATTEAKQVAVPEPPTREQYEAKPVEYIYFYRVTCPTCPPVRSLISRIELPGVEIDVDTDEGVEAALEYGIYTAPTVIFFNAKRDEVFRASSVKQLSGLAIPQMA